MAAVLNKIKSLTEEPAILAEPRHMKLVPVFCPDTKAYTVTVTNPRKVGEKNAYVAYTLKVLNHSDKSYNEVDRRYSDFDWLCEHLKTAHPSCVVPQIPEKTITGKFDESLMAFRARELMRFLQRVLAHPVMADDEAVQTFITANESEFAARRNRKEGKESSGFFFSLKQKAVNLTTGSKVDNDPEPWFTEMADDVLQREVTLTQMVQTVQKMINQYQAMIKKYVAHVASMRELISSLSAGSLVTAIENQCKALEQTKEYLEDIVCHLTVTVNGNLLDYIHELQAITAVLERRVPLVKTYLSTKSSSESNPSPELQAKFSEAELALNTFSNAARADIQQVCSLRNGDMQRFFDAIAQCYKGFYTLEANEWQKTLGTATPSMRAATQDAINGSEGAF